MHLAVVWQFVFQGCIVRIKVSFSFFFELGYFSPYTVAYHVYSIRPYSADLIHNISSATFQQSLLSR